MKLHAKLIISLFTVLLVTITISQTLQYLSLKSQFDDMSGVNNELLSEREVSMALNMHHALEYSVAGSLERGEMQKFGRILENQREVSGLHEFSLFDTSGNISHSSHGNNLGRQISTDLWSELNREKKDVMITGEATVQIYTPQIVDGDCIRCHSDWEKGSVGGILFSQFGTSSSEAIARAEASSQETQHSALFNSALATLCMLGIIAAAMWVFIRRFVTKPLDKFTHMLQRFKDEEGDLTNNIDIDTNDEIGTLARLFNEFVHQMRSAIGHVTGSTLTLDDATAKLNERSSTMKDSAANVQDLVETAAGSTEVLSESVEHINSASEAVSKSVTSVARSIEELNSTLQEVAQNCNQSSSITMSAAEQAGSANETMKELDAAADEIDKVLETITDIADQTNLLALNAAIEAASAGEAGKGFAVVASEVKELAKQTSTATEEIEKQIGEMQNRTRSAVETIQNISEIINESNQISQTIALAVEEQSATTGEIATAINESSGAASEIAELVRGAQENAATIAQIIDSVRGSSQITVEGAGEARENAGRLQAMADELRETVGHFKIE
jgi:methyl-accepting chemotaxis protein